MITSKNARNLLNFILFQTGWLACVLYPGLATVGLILVFLGLHLALVSQQRFSELQFIGFGVVLGGLVLGAKQSSARLAALVPSGALGRGLGS